MGHPIDHSKSAAKRFGGIWEDYIDLNNWFDATKAHEPSFRHRALRHHSQGIFEAEQVFGPYITNSDGKQIPTRVLGEQHVKEDFSGYIPTIHDWLKEIPFKEWMQPNPAYARELKNFIDLKDPDTSV